MTVTITTADFVGLLGDTIPFASGDDELPFLNSVRIFWDGDKLHMQATDRYRIAWASWHPDDEPEREYQGDIFNQPGSGDEPWSILVPLADAAHLVKTYKLPAKEGHVPLTVECADGRLSVRRHRDTGYPAIRTDIESLSAGDTTHFPDIAKALADHDVMAKVDGLAFTAKLVADFAKVRPRGPMSLRFTGEESPVLVSIGERFVGLVMPVRESDGATA